MVEVNPRPSARLPMSSASCGLQTAAADHGIDVHVKVGVLGEVLQLLVEDFQALLRNIVGVHVIDGNLQPLESGAIQAFNALGNQQVAVSDQASRSCRSCECAE